MANLFDTLNEDENKNLDNPLATLLNQPKVPSQTSDAIATLLAKNNDDLANAQQARNNMQLTSMLAQAGSTIGGAFTPLAKPVDNQQFFNALNKQAERPIEDLQNKQKMQQQGIQNLAAQQEAKNLMDKNDANSDISKTARSLAQQAAKTAKLDLNIPDNISLANLEKIMPGIENMANRRLQADMLAQNRQIAREQKGSDKQNQALAQTQQILESARGNPEVAQAMKDRYSASKALALINKNMDTNNMSPQEVKLLVSEVAKIATGGVPSMGEMEALTPNTLSGKLADVKGKLLNEPTPANAAKFIAKYKSYLDDLNENAQSVIKDKVGRVIETRKKQLGDENYANLKDQYLKPFETERQIASPKLNDEDKEAVEWAKKNKKDPRAQQILKLHGMN